MNEVLNPGLLNSPAADVWGILAGESLAGAFAGFEKDDDGNLFVGDLNSTKCPIYIGKMPADSGASNDTAQDSSIALFDIGGGVQDPKFAEENAVIQVFSRNPKYEMAYECLNKIRMALEGSPAITISGTRYIGFWIQPPPSFLARDENDRASWTMHIRTMREPLAATSGHRTTIGV